MIGSGVVALLLVLGPAQAVSVDPPAAHRQEFSATVAPVPQAATQAEAIPWKRISDALQWLSWLAAAVAALVAIFKFRSELDLGRQQRERDLRWKQAEAGKKLNDEMLEDPEATAAMQILDYPSLPVVFPSEEKLVVGPDDLRLALDPKAEMNTKRMRIRVYFDSFFYYMAMMQHSIENKLVLAEDVAFPLDYYVRLLACSKPSVLAYLDGFGLNRTKKFLDTQEGWRMIPNAR